MQDTNITKPTIICSCEQLLNSFPLPRSAASRSPFILIISFGSNFFCFHVFIITVTFELKKKKVQQCLRLFFGNIRYICRCRFTIPRCRFFSRLHNGNGLSLINASSILRNITQVWAGLKSSLDIQSSWKTYTFSGPRRKFVRCTSVEYVHLESGMEPCNYWAIAPETYRLSVTMAMGHPFRNYV